MIKVSKAKMYLIKKQHLKTKEKIKKLEWAVAILATTIVGILVVPKIF